MKKRSFLRGATPVDDGFEATMHALGQLSSDLVAARATILEQSQEIVKLRELAVVAGHNQEHALAQVKSAIITIRDARARTAEAEAALDGERAERMRLSDEMASIIEQVELLLGEPPPGGRQSLQASGSITTLNFKAFDAGR